MNAIYVKNVQVKQIHDLPFTCVNPVKFNQVKFNQTSVLLKKKLPLWGNLFLQNRLTQRSSPAVQRVDFCSPHQPYRNKTRNMTFRYWYKSNFSANQICSYRLSTLTICLAQDPSSQALAQFSSFHGRSQPMLSGEGSSCIASKERLHTT